MFSFFILFLYTEADKALGETWIAVKCSTDELSSILNRNLFLAVLTNCKQSPHPFFFQSGIPLLFRK